MLSWCARRAWVVAGAGGGDAPGPMRPRLVASGAVHHRFRGGASAAERQAHVTSGRGGAATSLRMLGRGRGAGGHVARIRFPEGLPALTALGLGPSLEVPLRYLPTGLIFR